MGRAKLSPQEFEQTKDELLRKLGTYSDSILLDPVKAAIVLDVSVHTLDQHRRKGLPPPYIKMTGMRGLVKYELGEIRRYIQECKVSSTSAASVRWGYQFCDGRHNFLLYQNEVIDVVWGKADLTLDALMFGEDVRVKRLVWEDAFDAEWEEPSLKSDYISDLEKHLMWRIEGLKGLRGNARNT
jgi:hypothetical protein